MTVPDGMALGGSVGTRHPYEAERSNNNNNVYAIEDLTYENFLGTSSSTKKKRKHSLSDESDNPYAPESFAHLDLRNGKWPPMPSHLRYYFRPQLEGFLRDPYNGAIIGWGYAPNQHLSYEQWQEAAQYGSWEAANYNTDGWALITHFLTIEQAKKKFGETTINKNDDGSFRNMCFTLTKDGKVLERTHFVVELQPKSNLRP